MGLPSSHADRFATTPGPNFENTGSFTKPRCGERTTSSRRSSGWAAASGSAAVTGEGLVVVDVEGGDRRAARVQRRGKRRHVDERGAGRIHEDRVFAHRREAR